MGFGFLIFFGVLQLLIILFCMSDQQKEVDSLQKPWVKIALWSIGLYIVGISAWITFLYLRGTGKI
jgi:hypothetical protein